MIAITVDELKFLLQKGEVHFIFEKTDGTKRDAKGTLREDLIPEDMKPLESYMNPKAKNPKYFDLDKNAWRSLSYDTSEVEVKLALFVSSENKKEDL